MFEMVVFMALIIPMPFTWRRKLFTFISESPLIAKLQYGMKVSLLSPSMCRNQSNSYTFADYVYLHPDPLH
jgi:hypothetical protein